MYSAREISGLIADKITSIPLPQTPAGLYDPARYVLGAEGKRIRPCLALMAANLFNDNIGNCIDAALAMEVFHNFTLVHDDIMDNAYVRRGLPSVHKKWDIPTAILSGDMMLIKSYQLLSTIEEKQFIPALKIFNDTAVKVCEGQQADMDFEKRDDVSLDEYIEMITNKTAVLLGCSLACGALAGGADEQQAALIYNAGVDLGISFQIQDDYLDAYGNRETFGKLIGGDIIQNKKTYLLLRTLQIADDDDKKTVSDLTGDNMMEPQLKIDTMISLFNKYNIPTEAHSATKKYFDNAMMQMKKINLPAERKTELNKLIVAVFGRSH